MRNDLKAVLFDLDGTLLNRNETFRGFLIAQLTRLGVPLLAASEIDRIMTIDDNARCSRADFYGRLAADLALPAGTADRLVDEFMTSFPEACVPMANLFPTLQTLGDAGLRLGLITNGNESIQGRKIDRLGIREQFDAIAISESIGVHKPDPRIFHHVLQALDVPPAAAAFVGDHPEMDVAGARRSGLLAIWMRDRAWPEPDEVDYIIDDLSDLPSLVLG